MQELLKSFRRIDKRLKWMGNPSGIIPPTWACPPECIKQGYCTCPPALLRRRPAGKQKLRIDLLTGKIPAWRGARIEPHLGGTRLVHPSGAVMILLP